MKVVQFFKLYTLFIECIQNFILYECFAMHMMTCQILVLGQNTRGVTLCCFPLTSFETKTCTIICEPICNIISAATLCM